MAAGWKRERRGPFSALCELQPLPWQDLYRCVAEAGDEMEKGGFLEALHMPQAVSLTYWFCLRRGAMWWQANQGIKPALWGWALSKPLEAEGDWSCNRCPGGMWRAQRQHCLCASSPMQRLLKSVIDTKDIYKLNLVPQHIHKWVYLSG